MSGANAFNRLEPLESRWLMAAVSPTDLEQYMVELVNRGRANPLAEAARLGVALNEGLGDGTISTSAKQPVAINASLLDAARRHSQWIINSDTFSHSGAGGSSPQDRMRQSGYAFIAPWSWAENIAIRSTNAPNSRTIDAIYKDFFVDVGIADRGHRINLLSDSSREIGLGIGTGLFTYFNAAAVTQDFASSANATYLTGVAYNDAAVKDQFYTPGEGLGGVTISARRVSDGATFTAKTWNSGGYSLKIEPGTYDVTASGGGMAKSVTYDGVTIGAYNVKRDFLAAGTVTPPPTPPPAPPTQPPTTKPTVTADRTPPTAKLRALRKRQVSRYYRFTVTFSDAAGISAATLGTGDILVKGAGGYARQANFVGADKSGDGTPRTVTYEVKGPRGVWNRAHNGVYTIWVQKYQVKDKNGNAMAGQQIGAFSVRVQSSASHVRRSIAPSNPPALAVKKLDDLLG